MTRRTLAPHLELDALEARYRQATDPVERSQWQILWLVGQGLAGSAISTVTGYSDRWIGTIVKRYNQDGPAAIRDHRHDNPGAPGLLSADDLTALRAALAEPPADGGVWNGPAVAAWMTARLGRPVHDQRGNEVLRALGFRPYVPRPRHAKADPDAQDDFKKKVRRRRDHRRDGPSDGDR